MPSIVCLWSTRSPSGRNLDPAQDESITDKITSLVTVQYVLLHMILKSELKFIKSLKIKKYRAAEKCFLAEGEKNVLELLNTDYKIRRLLVTADFLSKYKKRIETLSYCQVSVKELTSVSSFVANDQAVAVVESRDYSVRDIDLSNGLMVLDGIRDPGNLGTIIRTLDWFGFDQLVCSEDTAECYNPKVISATMGSFVRVKTVYCDLEIFLSKYKGVKVGADLKGESIDDFQCGSPYLFVMGSESHGISEPIQRLLDRRVTIQKYGKAESLNVGVATGIICHSLMAK